MAQFNPIRSKKCMYMYVVTLTDVQLHGHIYNKVRGCKCKFLMLVVLWNRTSPSERLGYVILPRFIPV